MPRARGLRSATCPERQLITDADDLPERLRPLLLRETHAIYVAAYIEVDRLAACIRQRCENGGRLTRKRPGFAASEAHRISARPPMSSPFAFAWRRPFCSSVWISRIAVVFGSFVSARTSFSVIASRPSLRSDMICSARSTARTVCASVSGLCVRFAIALADERTTQRHHGTAA